MRKWVAYYYFTHITSILIIIIIISLLICYKHYADNKNTSNVGKIMITDNSITILICLAPSIRLWERIGGARMMLRQVQMIRPALHNSWGFSINVALKLDGLWNPKNHGNG